MTNNVAITRRLIRNANTENRIYLEIPFGEQRLAMLAEVDRQRTKFEKEFRAAIDYLQKLQKQRPAAPVEPLQAVRNNQVKPHPGFVMSEPVDHPVYCAPTTADTR